MAKRIMRNIWRKMTAKEYQKRLQELYESKEDIEETYDKSNGTTSFKMDNHKIVLKPIEIKNDPDKMIEINNIYEMNVLKKSGEILFRVSVDLSVIINSLYLIIRKKEEEMNFIFRDENNEILCFYIKDDTYYVKVGSKYVGSTNKKSKRIFGEGEISIDKNEFLRILVETFKGDIEDKTDKMVEKMFNSRGMIYTFEG